MHSSRPLYESRWVTVSLAEVELPSGQHFEHHTVRLPAAAVGVVLNEAADHVLLSWRHRFVPGIWNYELPGGIVEDDESPAVTIEREILEETGYTVGDLVEVVSFEPMIGMVNSPHHVFVGRAESQVAQPVERDEGLFEWVSVADVPALIADGKIRNSGTLVGLLHLLASDRVKGGA
ncbi:NUDIX hydrolase [Dermatophilaceae bacterium Soc4.6]